jgi:O-antigen/teichoic acid export membrane protein
MIMNRLKWSTLGEVLNKFLMPILFIFYAFYLTPTEIGFITLNLMFISIAVLIFEGLTSSPYIYDKLDKIKVATITTVNLAIAIIISILYIWWLVRYDNTNLYFNHTWQKCIVVMIFPFLAINNAAIAKMRKSLNFKLLFKCRFISVFSVVVASIIFLVIKPEAVNILMSLTLGQILLSLYLILKYNVEIDFYITIKKIKNILRFGAWVGATAIIGWGHSWLDGLLVYGFLSETELGFYRIANQISNLPFILLLTPILPFLYSHFSQIQFSQKELKYVVERLSIFALNGSLVCICIGALLCILSEHVLSSDWSGVSVIAILALPKFFLNWLVGFHFELLRSQGFPKVEFYGYAFSLFFITIIHYIGLSISFDYFLYSRILGSIVIFFTVLFFVKVTLQIELITLLKNFFYAPLIILILILFSIFSINIIDHFSLLRIVLFVLTLLSLTIILGLKTYKSLENLLKLAGSKAIKGHQ